MSEYAPGSLLTEPMRDLVATLARALGTEIADVLDEQAAAARIVGGKPTMVDVRVPPEIGCVSLPDGPLPVTAVVVDDEGNDAGEVLIWIKAGRLIGLEQAWFTDSVPSRWPSIGELRLS